MAEQIDLTAVPDEQYGDDWVDAVYEWAVGKNPELKMIESQVRLLIRSFPENRARFEEVHRERKPAFGSLLPDFVEQTSSDFRIIKADSEEYLSVLKRAKELDEQQSQPPPAADPVEEQPAICGVPGAAAAGAAGAAVEGEEPAGVPGDAAEQ